MMTTETATPTVLLAKIQSHLATGKDARVVVATLLRATAFAPKHATMFRVSSDGDLQMQSGRRWLSIAAPILGPLVSIRLGRMK